MQRFAARFFKLIPGSANSKKYLKFAYFKFMAAVGVPQFPALDNLDRKLLGYLKHREGVFIEAGANDGISQSNTWFLETYRGWSGLLVEPVPSLARMARRFRRAKVFNVALGPIGSDGQKLTLFENDLQTTPVKGAGSKTDSNQIDAPLRSLSSLLDEAGIDKVDLFSLDVERYEIEVLKGLDFARHRPKFILVETAKLDEVTNLLAPYYVLRENFDDWNYLFEAK
jgi:FkbM family methyltransferase